MPSGPENVDGTGSNTLFNYYATFMSPHRLDLVKFVEPLVSLVSECSLSAATSPDYSTIVFTAADGSRARIESSNVRTRIHWTCARLGTFAREHASGQPF